MCLGFVQSDNIKVILNPTLNPNLTQIFLESCYTVQGFDEHVRLTLLMTVSIDTNDSESCEIECWREEVEEAGERLCTVSEGEELFLHSCMSPVSDLHRSFEPLLLVQWLRLRFRGTCFFREEPSLD